MKTLIYEKGLFGKIPIGITNGAYWIKECSNKINAERRKEHPFHYLLLTKKSDCKLYDIPFNLTDKDLRNLWEKQGGFCALSGLKMDRPYTDSDYDWVASLDRIDFEKGYVKNNVRYVLNVVNTLKGQKTDEFVFKIAKAIVKYNNL